MGTTGLAGCLDDLTTGGGGGPIQMGSILPITGDLESFGGGMQATANLAVEDINGADGPLDREIEIHNRDSETRPDAAVDRYESLVNDQEIIGFAGAESTVT